MHANSHETSPLLRTSTPVDLITNSMETRQDEAEPDRIPSCGWVTAQALEPKHSSRPRMTITPKFVTNIKAKTQTSAGCVDTVQCPPQVPSCCSAWEDCTAGRRVCCCCGHWVCHLHSRRQYTDAANPITIIVCRHCPQWDDGAMFDGLKVSLKDKPAVHIGTCEDVHYNRCKECRGRPPRSSAELS